jgi:hypothetical protein
LDQYITPFNVTYANSGFGNVQVTLSDPFPNSIVGAAYVAPNLVWSSASTSFPNGAGFLGQPVRAIRISGGSPGDTLTVIQAGIK